MLGWVEDKAEGIGDINTNIVIVIGVCLSEREVDGTNAISTPLYFPKVSLCAMRWTKYPRRLAERDNLNRRCGLSIYLGPSRCGLFSPVLSSYPVLIRRSWLSLVRPILLKAEFPSQRFEQRLQRNNTPLNQKPKQIKKRRDRQQFLNPFNHRDTLTVICLLPEIN